MVNINHELSRFIPIANLIAKTFGSHCEVVIHDLTKPQSSVIYTINNHVTGRQVGQPFDHLVKQVLLSKNFAQDFVSNYLTVTENGKRIKSSTALIRNNKNEVIGAFCVNYDLEAIGNLKIAIDDFLNVQVEPIKVDTEPYNHVMVIVDGLIEKIIGNVNPKHLKRKDKIEIIRFMNQKGIFLMKGAIDKVAQKLNISKVTVYSYLDEIKKE